MNKNTLILLFFLIASPHLEAFGTPKFILPTFPVYNENYQDTMLNDSDITSTLRDSIDSDPGLSSISSKISITSSNGIVTLTGEVHTEFQKTVIESRASSLNGVKEVNNNIVILPPPRR